jgi:uncharacterized protein DUF4396
MMEASAHAHHNHHEMPTSGGALTGVAISATLHCLTGCAIGEISGMAIGTALGLSNFATIVLAVALAFFFGYGLTSLPLLRAGLVLSAVIPIALASDTLSIATMEIIDNLIMVVIPGAMHAGLDDVLFWGSLSFALVIAGAVAVPVNRYLIARGKGHAVVHETGIHGGASPRTVGIAAAIAFVFGTTVLVAETVSGEDDMAHGGHSMAAAAEAEGTGVPGLAVSDQGMKLQLASTELPRGKRTQLRFRVAGADGRAVRDFDVEHTKRMHLIVARRDMQGFQHLHPRMSSSGEWSTPITVPEAGAYRVFADFKRGGRKQTLGADIGVDGPVDWSALPAPANTATTNTGYRVQVHGDRARAGRETDVRFTVARGGKPVHVDDYLGAKGHLVALREGDLGYLHTHPAGHGQAIETGGHDDAIAFATQFPTEGRYRLFLQFKVGGRVHTAAFTREVA